MMSFVEVSAPEDGDEDRGESTTDRFLVTYRVRVCKRCKHSACQYCGGLFCDICIDWNTPGEGTNLECAEEGRCSYEESEEDAVVEVSRRKISAEEEAAFDEGPKS